MVYFVDSQWDTGFKGLHLGCGQGSKHWTMIPVMFVMYLDVSTMAVSPTGISAMATSAVTVSPCYGRYC